MAAAPKNRLARRTEFRSRSGCGILYQVNVVQAKMAAIKNRIRAGVVMTLATAQIGRVKRAIDPAQRDHKIDEHRRAEDERCE
jgi:hypothetical protein